MREIKYNHQPGSLPDSLQHVPFFHELKSGLIDELLSDAVLLECDPGDEFICEGDTTKYFCILLKGAMDILKNGRKVGSLKHPGEVVGEMALVTGTRRTASVVASEHSFCLKIEPEFLEDLSDADSNAFYAMLYKFVSRILGERLEESSRKIARLELQLRDSSGGDVERRTDEPDVYRL